MMYSRQETITPEVAAAYLQKSVSNRPIQRMTVKNYARDMLNGKWELNEQGIGFYENFLLLPILDFIVKSVKVLRLF